MTTTIEKLLAIQDRDTRIMRFEKELRDLPAREKTVTDRLEAQRAAVGAAKEAWKARLADIKKLELEVEARRERIRKLREQQLQLKTNQEFRAIESEIAGVQRDIKGLEDQDLVLMETVEKAVGAVKEAEGALKAAEDVIKGDIDTLRQRAARIQAELQDTKSQREALAKEVDAEWLQRYERIMQNRKDRALVSVESGACGGCHMKLPPYLCHDARKQANMVFCEFCGRMLY